MSAVLMAAVLGQAAELEAALLRVVFLGAASALP
jgi:hypothetical protein